MAIDLHIHLARGDDNRLNGTVRSVDADEVRSFSGTLELLRVFEDLLAADAPAPAPGELESGIG
jgi:hypothetical protein